MAFGESLRVLLGIDNRAFSQGVRGAERQVRNLRRILGTLGIGLSGAAFGALARRATNFADEIAKAGKAADVTTEQIQKLRYAEEQAVGSSGQLERGLQRLGRRMVDQEKQFNDLGISVRDAEGNYVSVREGLDRVADAIQNAESQAERLNIAQRALGTEGRKMVPLLQQGSEGLRRFGDEAERAGRILDEDTIKQLEAAKQAMDDFGTRATIVMGSFLAKLLEVRDVIKDLTIAFDSSLPANESEARAMQSRAEAIRSLIDAGRIEETRTGGFGLGPAERRGRGLGGIIGGVSQAKELIEIETQRILAEKESRALRAEAITEEIRRRDEIAAKEQRQREKEQAAAQARVQSAREVAAVFEKARQDREFNELPLIQQIVRLEARAARERQRAEDESVAADERIQAAEQVVKIEEDIIKKRIEAEKQLQDMEHERRQTVERIEDAENRIAQAKRFTLGELATEAPGRIGTLAREAQRLAEGARSLRLMQLGSDGRGTPVQTPEGLRQRAEEIQEQLRDMGALRDEENVYKKALRESEERLAEIAKNTHAWDEFQGGDE